MCTSLTVHSLDAAAMLIKCSKRVSTFFFIALYIAPLYAGSFCQAFLATVDAVPDYYSSSPHMPLKNLAHMPKKFYLDLAGADEIMVSFLPTYRKTIETRCSRRPYL